MRFPLRWRQRYAAWPLIPIFELPLQERVSFVDRSGRPLIGADAHHVLPIGDDELAAWEQFLTDVQANNRRSHPCTTT